MKKMILLFASISLFEQVHEFEWEIQQVGCR